MESELIELYPMKIKWNFYLKLVRELYDILQLQTYFTSGDTETRAWTIRKGWTAPKAAGVIHGNFERGFTRADCVSYQDIVVEGSEVEAKSKGIYRNEGKDCYAFSI